MLCHVMEAHPLLLMKKFSTVIMMQVENETGLLRNPCDYCAKAKGEFIAASAGNTSGLPAAQKAGYMEGGFRGRMRGKFFMASVMAGAVEKITAAGQKEYPLPCFTRCLAVSISLVCGFLSLRRPGQKNASGLEAGSPFFIYAGAGHLYVPLAAKVMDEYGYEGNPLLVPRYPKDAVTASYAPVVW